MKNLLITLFLIVFLVSSCKKEKLAFQFEGKVTNVLTDSPIEGTKISAYSYELGGSSQVLQAVVTANSSGKYTLKIERDKYEKIKLVIQHSRYFTSNASYSIEQLTIDEPNAFNYQLTPKSWTKLIIQTENSTDKLKLQKVTDAASCEGCYPTGFHYFSGKIDTVLVTTNRGGSSMEIYYWLNENEKSGIKTINNIPFDTLTYSIP